VLPLAAWLGVAAIAGRGALAEPVGQDSQSAGNHVTADGDEQWVPIRGEEPGHTLLIRVGPGPRSAVVGWVPPDARVLATGKWRKVGASTWWEVAYLNFRGWVDGRFLAESPRPAELGQDGPWLSVQGVEADDTLNIRAAADPRSAILGRIPPDAQVRATGRSKQVGPSTWKEVAYLRVCGWVNGKFLDEKSRDPTSVVNQAGPTR
jgi:uncharacterized protein YraI